MRVGRACLAMAAATLLASCGERTRTPAIPGDAERGRLLLRQYGCGTCHRIPDVAAAQGHIGPPLDRVGGQVYLGGVVPNSPENMAQWIRAPQRFKPQTTMPDLQVQPAHATDMVAHLYRLR